MDVYRYFAEDAHKRFIFLFTYKPEKQSVLEKLKEVLGYEPYIYDIFPEPNHEEHTIEDILSVMTESGREMFIPAGLTINYFDQSRILFGEPDE